MGAVAAAMAGRSVVLVDKAWVGGSGESCFAAGDILYFDPEEDDLHEWLERWNRNGSGMFDPEWMEWYAGSSTEIVNMMNEWGMDFEKDANGRFKRKPGRGHNHAVVFPGFKMMRKLRARLEKLGVTIVDRVQVTDLLTNNGQVVGATGFNVRTGQFHVFHARNTILCTGSCSFKGQYHGQDMESGEGNTMALQAGAEFTNMEFSNCYNSTARDFDICGMSRFQRLGGRFTNALGEPFMDRYDPINKDGALLHVLVRAMTTEVREGRGPIYFNLKNMSEEDRELSYRIVPTFFAACKSCGIDPFKDSVEWIPGFMGSTSSGSGLTLKSFACDTTVPRLFAAGDMANQGLLIGSIAGAAQSTSAGPRFPDSAQGKARPEPVKAQSFRPWMRPRWNPLEKKRSPSLVMKAISRLMTPSTASSPASSRQNTISSAAGKISGKRWPRSIKSKRISKTGLLSAIRMSLCCITNFAAC